MHPNSLQIKARAGHSSIDFHLLADCVLETTHVSNTVHACEELTVSKTVCTSTSLNHYTTPPLFLLSLPDGSVSDQVLL